MAKFKVGDRVRIKRNAPDEPPGSEFNRHRYMRDTAVVVNLDMYPGRIAIEFAEDSQGDGWLMKENELEPAEYTTPYCDRAIGELAIDYFTTERAYFAADFIAALDDTAPALPVLPALPPLPLDEDTMLDIILNESDELKPKRIVQYPFGRNGEALP